ncbi:MAG: DnaJ domain-containing protein [bacterium]
MSKAFQKVALLLAAILSQGANNSLLAQSTAQLNETNCIQHLRNNNLLSKDLYQRLGLSKNSSQEDVKKAFRLLVTKVHGDTGYKTPGNDPSLEHKNLNEAYETLNNPDKRGRYDLLNPESGRRSAQPQTKTSEARNKTERDKTEKDHAERSKKESKEEKIRKILNRFPFENLSNDPEVRKSFQSFSRMIDESHDPFEAIIYSLRWHNRETTGLKGLETRPPIQEGQRETLKAIVRKYLPELLEKKSIYDLDILSEELQSIDPELSAALRLP